MKNYIFGALSILLFVSEAHASRTYECSRYVNGSPTGGHIKVTADSKSEAQQKAMAKYKDMDYRVDYVNCK